jgi:phosphoserine phosphatase
MEFDFKEKTVIKGNIEVNRLQIWTCKIGMVDASVLYSESGQDFPMRQAVAAAFMLLFGKEPDFLFSGWNADLEEGEANCVNNK